MNSLMAEVKLKRPYMTEEEYWEKILNIYYNSLLDTNSLDSIYLYYEKHDENQLTERAEKEILHYFGIK